MVLARIRAGEAITQFRDHRAAERCDRVFLAVDSEGHIGGFAEVSIRRRGVRVPIGPGRISGELAARSRSAGRDPEQRLSRPPRGDRCAQGCSEFASDTETHNELSIAAHHALGLEEVERLVCFRKATKACPTTGGCVKTDMDPRISRRSRSPQSCRKTVQEGALLSGFKCLPKPVDPHELTSVIARHGTNPVDSDVVAIRGA